jgi:hypothetical protein
MSSSTSRRGTWPRTLYLTAASLLLLSLVSCAMSLVPNTLQPNLPADGSLWKMAGLTFFLLSLVCVLAGILTTMFNQVERRSAERMRRELEEDLAQLSRNQRRK